MRTGPASPHHPPSSEPVQLLWTGGWDSTFRLTDLVITHGATVQPHYARLGRTSVRYEVRAMDRIRHLIAAHDPAAAARILPTRVHDVDAMSSRPDLVAHRDATLQRNFLGSQYVGLAALAERVPERLELAIHKDDQAVAALGEQVVRVSGAGPTDTWRVSPGADPALVALFGAFDLPLYELRKLDMERLAVAAGFADVLEATWFCHKPVRGRPCARCAPCRYTRDEGLARRIPRSSRALARVRRMRSRLRRRRS